MAYPGGKSGPGVYHRLINLIPPHKTYIEPFLGGGAIMRLKRPAAYNIGVDLDARVIREWRSRIGEASGVGSPTASGSAGSRADAAGTLGAQAEAAGQVKPTTAAGKRRREWRWPGAIRWAGELSAETCGSDDGGLADAARFRFIRGDALTFLTSYPFEPTDLIYCDPPYLPETLSSRGRYRHEFSDEQHRELLSTIGELPCRVMISGYWSELYAFMLSRWNSIHFDAMTRGGMATEWLWFNFPTPTALHDYRYLGESAHQRQDLKRQIASWRRKLECMPLLKKQALLSAIASAGESAAGIR